MRERNEASERLNARMVLQACNVAIGEDFDTLRASQVDLLLEQADRVRYRKPKSANGSRGRYFHALLQRRAR